MKSDLFNELHSDHEQVKYIFSRIEKAADSKRGQFLSNLEEALVPHMKAEEAVFYPALMEQRAGRELAMMALEEHRIAEGVLNECKALDAASDECKVKCQVLQELVEHHIQEEESKIFKSARQLLKNQLDDLQEQFDEAKKQAMSHV